MAFIDLGRGASSNGSSRGGANAATPSKPRLVMIIADPGRESTAAMEWALSHAIAEGDGILLLHTMSAACRARHPRARVRAVRVEPATEGREAKAQTILAESQRRGVELLVIGHRRVSSFLGLRGAGGSSRGHDSTAEFLIEHSKCVCVSVQKKGQNAGYLLNTKTHKNFWLLA
uniref:UspA domain-containing protein n=1 Tax=Leersia perrieri TaxID=77586 RepID=A0A0D9XKC9_9ORYZ